MNALAYLLFKVLVVFAAIIFSPRYSYAVDIVPFTTINQNPFIRIHGLPSPGNSRVTPPGKTDFQISLDLANHYIDDTAGTERIVLDGESYLFKAAATYGIAQGIECGIEIPYIALSGGIFDGFIESYHHALGLPQGGRDQAPKGRLLFQYQRNGIDTIKVHNSNSGFGDLSLTSAFQLYQSPNEDSTALALRAKLKLNTGDSSQMQGSGSSDLALWLAASSSHKWSYGHWNIFAAAGAIIMSNGRVLESQQRRMAGFGSVGMGWSPSSWLALKIQFDGNTPFYKDSDLVELNSYSAQITIGGTLSMYKQVEIDIGVTEDIIVKTAPDVVLHLAVKSRF